MEESTGEGGWPITWRRDELSTRRSIGVRTTMGTQKGTKLFWINVWDPLYFLRLGFLIFMLKGFLVGFRV